MNVECKYTSFEDKIGSFNLGEEKWKSVGKELRILLGVDNNGGLKKEFGNRGRRRKMEEGEEKREEKTAAIINCPPLSANYTLLRIIISVSFYIAMLFRMNCCVHCRQYHSPFISLTPLPLMLCCGATCLLPLHLQQTPLNY